MKGWVAVGMALLACGTAAAQQPQEDPAERALERMRNSLNLREDQIPKVREILKKQYDEIRTVLDDQQKAQLNQGGGGRGNRGQAQPGQGQPGQGQPGQVGGGRGSSFMPSTNDLKAALELTDEQTSKINEIRDAATQQRRQFFQNRGRGQGGNPMEEWNAFQQKLRDDAAAKMREVLTDAQKPKFDELLKNFIAQAQQNTPAPTPGQGRGGRTVEERLTSAMEALKIENAQEADAIKSVVKKVLEAMEKLDTQQRDARGKIDEASRNTELSDEAVGDRIAEILTAIRDVEKELSAARKELVEIVTNRQELELLRRGILR